MTAALVLMVNSHQIAEENGGLWRAARQAVGFTLVIEAFANLFVMPLAAEVVLLPVATFVAMALVVAQSEDEYEPIARLFSAVQVMIGSLALAFVIVRLAGLAEPDWRHIGRALVLPIWLTLGTLPLVYAIGLYGESERQMLRPRLRRAA